MKEGEDFKSQEESTGKLRVNQSVSRYLPLLFAAGGGLYTCITDFTNPAVYL